MSAVINDLSVLALFLLVGLALRELVKPLQKLFLPAGLIGGVVALIVGPQVLGWMEIPKGVSGMPTPMITVVLTCIIFGTKIEKSRIKQFAGSVVVDGLTYFSQMFVGTLVGMALSIFWPMMPKGWGLMAAYTYWGGHGAAASAGKLFESLGEAQRGMLDLGIIMATLGLIVAMVVGMTIVNWGVRKGYATSLEKGATGKIGVASGPIPVEKQKSLGSATVASDALNGLALQLALVLVSIWLGTVLFTTLKTYVPGAKNIPVFLYGIVGALIIWTLMCRLHIDGYADKKAIGNISGVALEICICAATATLNLKMVASFLVPILIHMLAIIVLMIFICVFLTKRWFKDNWLETGLLFFGQGTGSAPSGLALARCTDPDTRNSPAWEGFGVAMSCFTPVTSTLVAIVPILTVQSIWYPVAIGGILTVILLVIGEKFIKKN